MWRKALIICITLFVAQLAVFGQNFGEFASAIGIQSCGTTTSYNLTGSGANCINTNCATVFQGAYFGTFVQNAGTLMLQGGELKTFKNAGANVCGGTIFYTIYPTGMRPATPVFSTVNLPFAANCSGSTFADGFGPCGGNDQKWRNAIANINITNFAPGNYSLELYIQYSGDDFSTSGCGTNRFISNGGFNYIATFDIIGSGTSCGISLPIELIDFEGICTQNAVQFNWSTASEVNSYYFNIQHSKDLRNWETIFREEAHGHSKETKYYSVQFPYEVMGDDYFRLIQVDRDATEHTYAPIFLDCEKAEEVHLYLVGEPGNLIMEGINLVKEEVYQMIWSNTLGQTVNSMLVETDSRGSCKIPLSGVLPQGVYFVYLHDSSGNRVEGIPVYFP